MDKSDLKRHGIMICVPSYKRAGKCKTVEWLSGSTIWVHEFESEIYKREYPDHDVYEIPDVLSGSGMAKIRNYILENAGSSKILMMDDDISAVGYYDNCSEIKFDESEFYDFVANGFVMAEELGTCLWGINQQTDKKFYREYTPFSLSVPILGPFMGVLVSERTPRFDDDLGLKEDYDFFIQVMNIFRKVLRFNKYHYLADHIQTEGGCASYRSRKKEQEQMEALERKWGTRIVDTERQTANGNQSINPRVHIPIGGI